METLFSHFKETRPFHEVNVGAVLAYREIGRGHSAMTTFSKVMNMPALKNDSKYHEWKASHNCKVNHTGSANSMDTVGALRIFERSLATRGLKYKDMVGDSDSATCNTIVENKPYGENCIPNKLECIGHVQQKVGSRLRKLKSANKELKLDDGKVWLEKVN